MILKLWLTFYFFLYFSLDLLIFSLEYVIIYLMSLIKLLDLLTSINFFSNRCSKSWFSSGADKHNLFVFRLI